MSVVQTLKIINSKSKDGYAIINESEFDSKKHKLFDEAPKAKAKAKAAPKAKAKAKAKK
jgi:hypothetical protein